MRLSVGAVALGIVLLTTGCASWFSGTPRHSPLAYRLENPNGASGWLFGSLHHGRDARPLMPPRLQQALDDAELVVLEIDLSRTSEGDLVAAMLELGSLEEGLRLRDVITRDTWAAVVEHAQETGSDLAALDRLEPWVVYLFFSNRSLERAGFDSEHGVERTVMAEKPETKPVRGLETPEEQFSAFDGLPLPLQERLLLDAIAEPGEATGGDIRALAEAWVGGDAQRLEAILIPDDDPEMAPFYERIYFRRNHHMARGLRAILDEQSNVFAIVGVGHLLGEEGLPRLLEDSGLRVERVWFD